MVTLALLAGLAAAHEFAVVPVSGTLAAEISAEIRLPLTRSGYDKIGAAFAAGAGVSTREDFYFDGFDGSGFRLKYLPEPIKLRIKDKGGKPTWQVIRLEARRRVEAAGLWADVSTAESREGPLKGIEDLRALCGIFFSRLAASGGGLRSLADSVDEGLSRSEWPGKDLVDRARAGLPATRLYPAASNVKERRSFDLALPGGQAIPVKLGLTRALDESGRAISLYELESDLSPGDANRMVEGLLRALADAGLTRADLGGPSPDAFLFTARRLRDEIQPGLAHKSNKSRKSMTGTESR